MILTDFYRFEKLPIQKSKSRIDCTCSTGSYNPLENLRNKRDDLFLYIGRNTHTKAGKDGKSDLALTKTEHISSMYNKEPNLPFWYGDMKGTTDAFLFVLQNVGFVNGGIQAGAVIDLFVARGQSHNMFHLYEVLLGGELDEEMNALRKRVAEMENKPEKAGITLY